MYTHIYTFYTHIIYPYVHTYTHTLTLELKLPGSPGRLELSTATFTSLSSTAPPIYHILPYIVNTNIHIHVYDTYTIHKSQHTFACISSASTAISTVYYYRGSRSSGLKHPIKRTSLISK